YVEKTVLFETYGLPYFPAPSAGEEFTVNRTIGRFCGKRLVFGASQSKITDYTIDWDTTHKPDLVANYLSNGFWKKLPDRRFKEVVFVQSPYFLNSSLLEQTCRVLKVGGTVRFACEGVFEWANKINEKTLADFFSKCGFSNFELLQERRAIVVLTK